MDPRLIVTQIGNIDELYEVIHENPYILESIDAVPFINTPLHVASASGNLPLAMEIMNLKPSFARKLNTYGLSPLHLAIEEGQTRLVLSLLKVDPNLVRLPGREGAYNSILYLLLTKYLTHNTLSQPFYLISFLFSFFWHHYE